MQAIINDLLSTLHAVTVGRWEDFDFITATLKKAQDEQDSSEYTLEQRQTIVGILDKILPKYEPIRQRYQVDPDFKKEIDTLREYVIHMKDLRHVIDSIKFAGLDETGIYKRTIGMAAEFLLKEGNYLPKEKRIELANKVETARSKFNRYF